MDSFNQKVDRINAAKEAIKVSLTNKGLNPTDNIEDYAALVDSIEQGSGSGSTIKVYNSIEAMQADKANMNQNDICEIHENYEYICPLSFLGEGDEVSFNNVIIPTQFIIGKFGVNALTLKYANPEGTEHLTFKKAVLNTTKLTLTYKLANQDEVSHVYTYSDDVGGYVSDLSETLILNFNSTLSLVTDASLGSVKSRINTKLNKEVLTYVYKFNNGDFEVLQGFNDTIATVVPDIENVHLGKDGDLALALIKPNESIKPDVLYNFITFKPEINKSDIAAGDYSIDIEAQIDAPAVVPSMTNRLSFIVTDATITISLQINLMGINAISYADITYTLEGDKYKLADPQVWEVRGDISIGLIGDMKIEGFKIPTDSWDDVYSLILNGAPEFKGIYEYNNVTKSLYLAPNQFTAIAKDVKQGKSAYSLDGVIEGTATDLGTLEITATKESQSLSGGFVDKIKVKAVDATIDENIQPENIKAGVQIFDVVGTLQGSDGKAVKLFETKEDLLAYKNPIQDDLALIYRKEMINWDGTSAISAITFPNTVVLSQAETGSCYGYGYTDSSHIDLEGSISSTQAYFRIYGEDYYTIRYTSSDGLTYTRADSEDETIIVSTEPISIEMYEWADVIGNFMTVKSAKLEGLYNYITKADPEYTEFIRNADYDSEDEPYYETTNIYTKDLINFINETVIPSVSFSIGNVVIVKNNDSQYTIYTDNSQYTSSEDCVNAAVRSTHRTNGKYYIARYNNNSDNIKTMHKFIINTTDWTFTHETQELGQFANGDDISGLWFTTINIKENVSEGTKIYAMVSYSTDKNWYISYYPAVSQILRWHVADTQFTATNANQLLPGVKVLGKNGPIEGDKTIYDNLEPENYIGKLLNTEMIPEQINGTVQYFPDYINSKDVVTLPEENIQIHYIKNKILENEDLLLTSLDSKYGVKTTDDGKFSIKKADGDDSKLYNIINNETGEITTYSVPFTNSLNIVEHKVYGFSIDSAFSGTSNTIKAFCYDFDTLTETVNFTQKFEESFKGSGSSASSGYRVIPSMDLVIMYVDINRSESSTSYSNECGFYAHLSTLGTDQFKYWYKDINASSSNRINHFFVTTTQGTILQAKLKGSYGSTSDSTFVEYNPSDMSVINTCTATGIGTISEDTAGGVACVYKSPDNYVYIKCSGKYYKLNLKTGAYELYEGDLPLYSDNYIINPFNYSNDGNIRTYKIFGNKDLNVTFTFSISNKGKFYSYYGDLSACYASHDEDKVTLKNSNGIIYGIPYVLGDISDYDHLLIPVASVNKTILPVYIPGPKFN